MDHLQPPISLIAYPNGKNPKNQADQCGVFFTKNRAESGALKINFLHSSVRPKFGIGRKYRPKPLVSVSVSEPKLLQPKPKLQYIDFSEITLSTYVHVLHGKSEIT